jgi:hypothetical protein
MCSSFDEGVLFRKSDEIASSEYFGVGGQLECGGDLEVTVWT